MFRCNCDRIHKCFYLQNNYFHYVTVEFANAAVTKSTHLHVKCRNVLDENNLGMHVLWEC